MTNDRQLVGNHISGRMLNFTSMSWRDGRSLLAGKPPCSLNPWSQVSIMSYWFDIILLKILCMELFSPRTEAALMHISSPVDPGSHHTFCVVMEVCRAKVRVFCNHLISIYNRIR